MSIESVISIKIKGIEELDKLNDKLNAIKQISVKINLEPSFKDFDNKVKQKLQAMSFPALKIGVEPDFRGLGGKVASQINNISVPDIKVKIKTESDASSPSLGGKSWAKTGWGDLIPGGLKTIGSGGGHAAAYGLDKLMDISKFAMKLPFQVIGKGIEIGKKGLDVLMAGVKSILSVVGSVFKMLGIGLGSGIGLATAGVLGVIGQSKDVASRSYTARGMVGTGAGDMARLQAAFGQTLDVGSFMQGISEQQLSVYGPALVRSGIGPRQAKGMSTEQAALQVLTRARRGFKQIGVSDVSIRSLGLEGLIDLPTAQRLSTMPEEEFQRQISFNQQYRQATQIPREAEYREFEQKRGFGMAKMDTLIKNEVVNLLKPMERLFNSIISSFEKRGGQGGIHYVFQKFAEGMDRLAQAFEKDEWGKLAEDIFKVVAKAGSDAMEWMWAEFKKHFEKPAEALEELWKAIKQMLPSWEQLKTLGKDLQEMLPSWNQFIEGIKQMPVIFARLEDSFWVMLETIDRAWQSLAHPFKDYERSAFALAPEGSKARDMQDARDYMRQQMLAEQSARDPMSTPIGPGVKEEALKAVIGGPLYGLPRGIRNNNPGNLNFAGQAGAEKESGQSGRFSVFKTAEEGLRAMASQLMRYSNRGIDTIKEIVGKYAPESENNTAAYRSVLSKALGISEQEKVDVFNPEQMRNLMEAMIRHENKGMSPYSKEQFMEAIMSASNRGARQDPSKTTCDVRITDNTSGNTTVRATTAYGACQ